MAKQVFLWIIRNMKKPRKQYFPHLACIKQKRPNCLKSHAEQFKSIHGVLHRKGFPNYSKAQGSKKKALSVYSNFSHYQDLSSPAYKKIWPAPKPNARDNGVQCQLPHWPFLQASQRHFLAFCIFVANLGQDSFLGL